MRLVDLLVLAGATGAFSGCLCRLISLDIRHDCRVIILMHAGLSVSMLWAGYHAWFGSWTAGDIASIVGTASWIVISYGTWRHGVPEHFRRGRLKWPHISDPETKAHQ